MKTIAMISPNTPDSTQEIPPICLAPLPLVLVVLAIRLNRWIRNEP